MIYQHADMPEIMTPHSPLKKLDLKGPLAPSARIRNADRDFPKKEIVGETKTFQRKLINIC